MPKPGTRNVLYILENGDPDEWAICRDVPIGEYVAGVRVYRFDGVPDDIADDIEEFRKPKHLWGELMELPHEAL